MSDDRISEERLEELEDGAEAAKSQRVWEIQHHVLLAALRAERTAYDALEAELATERKVSGIRREVAIESIAILGLEDVRGAQFSREVIGYTFDRKVEDVARAAIEEES